MFTRAYVLTSNVDYRAAAELSARVLITSVKEGGVLDHVLGTQPWIEEYPTTPPIHVLNGCLFGLIALVDCAQP